MVTTEVAHHPAKAIAVMEVRPISPSERPSVKDDEFWRVFLTEGDPRERAKRRIFKRLPHGPRCRLCAAPFAGPAAPLMRMLGRRPSGSSPAMCTSCFDFLSSHRGGAEIEGTMLFADVRGSTSLAESMSPTAFRVLLDRFYAAATSVVFDHDGTIDKFVGDELVAFFVPLLSGQDHAVHAVTAAQTLLRVTGHADPDGPWLPVGAGVHTGVTWFGTVGDGRHVELTALGDAMNTAARLASRARAGEILVSSDAADAAGLDPDLERRQLELKGKAGFTEVVTLEVAPTPPQHG